MTRITPAEPPYEPAIAAELARIMPPGIPPLVLFRTMAGARASLPRCSPAAFWTKARSGSGSARS
jgi:hypothetical protein